MLALLLQFAFEVLRALLVDELSGHVRHGVILWVKMRTVRKGRSVVWGVHRQNRQRLLNRLLAEIEEDL